jgi:hypothetical protein
VPPQSADTEKQSHITYWDLRTIIEKRCPRVLIDEDNTRFRILRRIAPILRTNPTSVKRSYSLDIEDLMMDDHPRAYNDLIHFARSEKKLQRYAIQTGIGKHDLCQILCNAGYLNHVSAQQVRNDEKSGDVIIHTVTKNSIEQCVDAVTDADTDMKTTI